ncbi:hypothetical protein QTP88_028725 [Uroleucon formosanum]
MWCTTYLNMVMMPCGLRSLINNLMQYNIKNKHLILTQSEKDIPIIPTIPNSLIILLFAKFWSNYLEKTWIRIFIDWKVQFRQDSSSKCIGELNIVEINWELLKCGIQTGGPKSAQVLEEKTLEAQSEEDEVNPEKILMNQFIDESVERLERELAEEKLMSTERVVQEICICRGNSLQGAIRDRNRSSGNQSGVTSEMSRIFRDLFGSSPVSGEVCEEVIGKKLKSELLENLNGDELQFSLQSKLLSNAQTKSKALVEYFKHKCQLYRRFSFGLIEEAVVRTVVGISTSGPPKLKLLDKRKTESVGKSHDAGSSVCGNLDYLQAACSKRKSDSGNLTEQLLICKGIPEVFSEEFFRYPWKKECFSDLRTEVFDFPVIATVVCTCTPKRIGHASNHRWQRSFTKEPKIFRMADGYIREITECSEFRFRIVDLGVSFWVAVLDDSIGDVFLGYDLVVEQQVAWDYSGCIIHLGKGRRVSMSWRNLVTPVTVEVYLTTTGLLKGEYGLQVKQILRQYLEAISGEVGRTRVMEHHIHIPWLNAYWSSREKNEVIAEMFEYNVKGHERKSEIRNQNKQLFLKKAYKSEEALGIGRMKLVLHKSGKIPEERDRLNKYAKGVEITYLQFLKNILGIKSGPGLEVETREQRDSNTSIKSIEIECNEEDKTFGGL